ncbi:FAD binding domain-containing [Fusarium albosuccineum]|uniref:FAD binding domain-containing n=1 Tax=Fusarium albosuccineum TaxID=1237068 RepID=A0A8H4P593_9HYPO|nr:FAD binding domain-containing [Fusarium albosuccineum]
MLPPSFTSLLALSFVAASASAATDPLLETSDFNVTEALLDHGVDVSEIPALADDKKRSDNGCAAACASLKFLYGDAATPTGLQTADVNPYCIFKPSRTTQVSILVLLARLTQCPFAAKSGGHAAFAGASSVEGGITVSFANLKGVSLSKDKKIASIEPGNIWGPVFEELTKSDLTVVGGRLYNIGVGGLTTGGGISYFPNLYGWACDNVDSYEVVLANGLIVKASTSQYSDLYWALKGGGNNFGLVVSFNLKTAGLYVVFNYSGGTKLAIPALYYSEPDAGDAPIWDDFNAITSISDTTKNRVLAEWSKETMNDSPPGLREIYYVITSKVDHDILTFARDLFYETVPSVGDIPGIIPNLVVQGITTPQLQQMKKNGGNALGLDVAEGPLFILQLCAMWDNKSDDAKVYRWMSDVLEKVSAEANSRGVDNDYVYMNYASQFQDVISTYGSSNKAKLKSISKKYDPQQVFQVLQPGYFKLDRAPIPDSGHFSH